VVATVVTTEIISQSDEMTPELAAAMGPDVMGALGRPTVDSRKYRLVDNGLEFDPDTTYDEWERDTLGLIEVSRKIHWALADALAFGEDKWGEDASNVLDETPFSSQTLWSLASYARQIPRELRNDQIPFWNQVEVAYLESDEDKKEILRLAAEKGLKQAEIRDVVRATKRQRRREEAERKPDPGITPSDIFVEVADARALPLADGVVNLLLTSPPYGIMDGESGVRKYNTSDDWRDWAALLDDFADEAYRVLAEGGRLVLNVPYDTWVGGDVGGQRPTYHRALTALLAAGLTYVTTINWREGTISKSVARGSVDSPSTVRAINPNEALIVVCKGPYGRLEEMKARGLTTDLTHDEWLAWTMADWEIPGESNPWEGFEAAFPPELARRVMTLFSFREDVVCDPFVGSGTSAYVAWRLGRTGHFFDLDPKRVASTKRRLLR
jgi:DNA modification methylase